MVVDTSALLAIAFEEPLADWYLSTLTSTAARVIYAVSILTP